MIPGRTVISSLCHGLVAALLAVLPTHELLAFQSEQAAAVRSGDELSLTALQARGERSAVQVLAYFNPPPTVRARGGETHVSQSIVRVGSGVRFEVSNRVLTALGIVVGADSIEVQIGSRTMPAVLLGSDRATQLALLSVNDLIAGNEPAPLATGPSLPGDAVILVDGMRDGPVLYHGTVTQINPRGLIYTTLPVLAGLSGAPLLNTRGEVVGIVTLLYRTGAPGSVLGDAVGLDVSLAVHVAREIEEYGQVRWGWFGADADALVTDRIVISGVDPEGPAARAGLRAGDVVTHYGGQSLDDIDHLASLVLSTTPGTTVPIGVERDSFRVDLFVVVGDRSSSVGPGTDLSLIAQHTVDRDIMLRMRALVEELNLLMLDPSFDPGRADIMNRIGRLEREIGELRRVSVPDRPPPS